MDPLRDILSVFDRIRELKAFNGSALAHLLAQRQQRRAEEDDQERRQHAEGEQQLNDFGGPTH